MDRKGILYVMVAVCAAPLAGCSSFTYTEQGVFCGAVVGAGVGAGFGSGPGALAGAGIGGLCGGLIGHELEVRRHRYPPFTARYPDYVAPSYCVYPNMPYPMIYTYPMPYAPPPPGPQGMTPPPGPQGMTAPPYAPPNPPSQ